MLPWSGLVQFWSGFAWFINLAQKDGRFCTGLVIVLVQNRLEPFGAGFLAQNGHLDQPIISRFTSMSFSFMPTHQTWVRSLINSPASHPSPGIHNFLFVSNQHLLQWVKITFIWQVTHYLQSTKTCQQQQPAARPDPYYGHKTPLTQQVLQLLCLEYLPIQLGSDIKLSIDVQ